MFSDYQFEINSLIGQDQNQINNPNQTQNFPTFDRNGFNELLHAIQAMPTIPTIPETSPELQVKHNHNGNGRKRSIRRDRHSKIVTASGPRDRRMRLSLDVAKKFFDLQDVLGFDKASKTVDWLLTKSKDAIKSLSPCGIRSEHKGCNSGGNWKIESSSTSECEVDSANPEDEEADDRILQSSGEGEITRGQFSKSSSRKVTNSRTRKVNLNPILLKESRAKARERARERTREKMMMIMNTKKKGAAEVEQKQNSVQANLPNTSILESAEHQSLPMMIREITTSDYNMNIGGDGEDEDDDAIDGIDPYSLYQEFWNRVNSSSTVIDRDEHGITTASAQFHRIWAEEFNNQIK